MIDLEELYKLLGEEVHLGVADKFILKENLNKNKEPHWLYDIINAKNLLIEMGYKITKENHK